MFIARKLLINENKKTAFNNNNNKNSFISICRKLLSSSSSTNSMIDNNNTKIHVEVNQGIVAGYQEQLPNGKPYFLFKGIPYAYPPIGELRFMPPKPLRKFTTPILDCTEERDVCFHKDPFIGQFIGSEDCLYLNVYTPSMAAVIMHRERIHDQLPVDTKLPVMIWIHGGAYITGSGSQKYYSPEFIVQENVIVVTFNYRLGPFGYLYLPKANVYPNAGLKDQLLVFKWVKDNIQRFGGDPDNVTLFGESAGAACVHLHALSENSKKYFHKAICQSGTAIMDWVYHSDLECKSKLLAKSMGCTSTDDKDILDFLNNIKDTKKIYISMLNALNDDEKRRGLPMIFKPAIEPIDSPDAILTKNPLELLCEMNSIGDTPMMIGYNSNEGAIMLTDLYKKLHLIESDLGRYIPRSLNILPDQLEFQQLTDKLREFYFNGKQIDENTITNLNNLTTDFHFGFGAQMTAEIHALKQHKSPMYFYIFSYDGDYNFYKKMVMLRCKNLQLNQIEGACHGDEMYYLFNFKMFNYDIDIQSPSGKMLLLMCKMWTNFAKCGNPTPSSSPSPSLLHSSLQTPHDIDIPIKWLPVMKLNKIKNQTSVIDQQQQFQLDYLNIDEVIQMNVNPYPERFKFWRNIYQKWNGNNYSLKTKL